MVGPGLGRGARHRLRGPRLIWLSNVLGGLLFGFGMVLASGCGSKTLVRIGGGSLKALVVFCVLAIASYATLRGVVAVARVATVDTVALSLPAGQDLPSLLAHATGASVGTWALALGVGLRPGAGGLRAGAARRALGRRAAGGPGHRCGDRRRVVGVGPARPLASTR